MKILFVSSGNSVAGINPLALNQANSLIREGIEVEHYGIRGKGWGGYAQNIFPLRKKIKQGSFNLIHAHYALSGFAATLTFYSPLVVSLMGSDIEISESANRLIRFCSRNIWKATIVKSERMKEKIGLPNAYVIPNGVDLDLMQPQNRSFARHKVGFNPDKKHVLFLADPARYEKNYPLALAALNALNDPLVEMHTVYDVRHGQVPFYLSAADCLLSTSIREGSSNVIKEALACNCPVVATDVGDARKVAGDIPGCTVTSFDPLTIAAGIKNALTIREHFSGRDKLKEKKLDVSSVARRIIDVYNSILAS